MFEQTPNGYFLNDLIVFNSLKEGGFVSKGFIFEAPDLTNAQVGELNDFQDQLSLMLASLGEQQRLQIQFFCDSDCHNNSGSQSRPIICQDLEQRATEMTYER